MKSLYRFCATFMLAFLALSAQAYTSQAADIRLGVLSNRGDLQARTMWARFSEYLAEKSGQPVQLIPLSLDKAGESFNAGHVDLLLVNPIIATRFFAEGKADPLAMLVLPKSDRFGGVIIASKKSGIKSLDEIKGKKLMFLNRSGAGAFLFQAYHLLEKGINVDKDFSTLQQAQKQDDIVLAVRAGLFDVGFIRTGLLEDMVASKKIQLDDVTVLDPVKGSGYPFLHTTTLYPEWFMIARKEMPSDVKSRITDGLVQITPDSDAAKSAEIAGFRAATPEDMAPIIALMKAMKLAPFAS